MEQVKKLASSYTPEWRYENAEDDPGAAIARLFGEMFYQTVDRFNAVPNKLFVEFLEMAGVKMPDPLPATGLMQFTAHDTVENPVPVPAGTQVFTRDETGSNIAYETERRIEATPAKIAHVFYVDAREEVIEHLDPEKPCSFFTTNGGENLQCHRFSLSHNEVLALSGPCEVELEILAENRFTAAETAKMLADAKLSKWLYRSGGTLKPFDAVRAEGAVIILTKSDPSALEAEEDGNIYITCESGMKGGGSVLLRGARLSSKPLSRQTVDAMSFGDVPIPLDEGGYCFGRRPTPYALFYLRSDRVFCKRGATVNVQMDIAPVITDLTDRQPQYNFQNQRIIDKSGAVAVQPEDVFVSEVVWEYFNGTGWTRLPVRGNKNPFSCKDTGNLETVFDVPKDIKETEVNAETGFFVRARVVFVENEFSTIPRWIVPFVKGAECAWSYAGGLPAKHYRSENNGCKVELLGAEQVEDAQFVAIRSLSEKPRAMYFCFDRSPHAMPLSMLFEVGGRAPMDDKLVFEACTGGRFKPVRSVDLTRNLAHTGTALLYLPEPLPEAEFFGKKGCWIRLIRSSYQENSRGYPRVQAVRLNTVAAVQKKRAEEQWFDCGVYEAGKVLQLLETPVQDCRVWVDEIASLAVTEAEELAKALPDRVKLVKEDGILTHCWVLWERMEHLALADREARGYQLNPYEGTITFGDGIHGRVPPPGERNIRVYYASGGGERGNRPARTVTDLVGALPRISAVKNLTPMSGGTDRFPMEKLEALGNRRIRHRRRAIGVLDFEEMVAEAFPQALHVKCFARKDETGAAAPGHITVVIEPRDTEGGPAVADLCDRVWDYLKERCSCTLVASGQLHVIPSTVVTVNTEISVELEDPDEAAATQQIIEERLADLIHREWRKRDIGDQVRIDQIWQVVRDTPNVRFIEKILIEGVYDKNGISRSVPLEDDRSIPYATVRNGAHRVRIL